MKPPRVAFSFPLFWRSGSPRLFECDQVALGDTIVTADLNSGKLLLPDPVPYRNDLYIVPFSYLFACIQIFHSSLLSAAFGRLLLPPLLRHGKMWVRKEVNFLPKNYNLGSSADMRRLQKDLEKAVNEKAQKIAQQKAVTMLHEIKCPHCGSHLKVRMGKSTCPICHGSINLEVNIHF